MKRPADQFWNEPVPAQLVQVLAGIDDAPTMRKFLRDVLTEKEIIEISARLEAARLLRAGVTYTEIVERTRLSSRTVARISSWLRSGNNGYAAALKQIDAHQDHTPPARA